jgi:hypothetical protein
MMNLTKEEVEYQSFITTQQSLIDLGTSIAKKDLEESKLQNDIKELEKSFISLSDDTKSSSKQTIVENIIEYIDLVKQREQKNVKNLSQKDSEILELRNENNDNILEIDKLESRIEDYWAKRVQTLRDKCIEKNNIINRSKYLVTISNIVSWCIGYFGIFNVINNIYALFSRIIFITYQLFQLIGHYCNIIYNIIGLYPPVLIILLLSWHYVLRMRYITL